MEIIAISKPKKTFVQRTNLVSWLTFALCVIFAAMCIIPLWLMLINATRNSEQIQQGVSFIPSTYLFKNIKILLDKDFPLVRGFINSVIISASSTVLSVYFSALTAYGFTLYNFRFKKALYASVLGIIMIPGQLGMIGWYQLVVDMKMYNTYIPLIIPGIASASTVFFLRQYMAANFAKDIVEAARIDGAGEFYTFNKIAIPLVMPALLTMAIFAIIGSWNNYMGPLLIISSKELYTFPMLLELLKTDIYKTDYGSVYAGILMTVLPLLIIYFLFSKQIIRGVALGGVKE